jgi:UDP-N-acetylmuramoylalanine--D-glutamate ligase
VHVIEMSSFQIDLTPSLAPTVGVLLNITPDHLDRHGTMEDYAAIKERLVARAEVPVVGIDDAPSRVIAERLLKAGREVLALSADMLPGDGYHFEGTRIFATAGTSTRPVADLKGIGSLRGAHNAQNAAAAIAVAEALGLAPEEIEAGLASFPGLRHRMEEAGRRGSVLFVNDSKATNADSTEKALSSFEHVFWILGGKAKEGGIEPLRPLFTKIDKAYLIGAATEQFAATLDGVVPFARCETLDRAVAEAAQDAARSHAKEPVVLLSPACASYDQYPNFEVRGDHFRELVRALPGVEMRG